MTLLFWLVGDGENANPIMLHEELAPQDACRSVGLLGPVLVEARLKVVSEPGKEFKLNPVFGVQVVEVPKLPSPISTEFDGYTKKFVEGVLLLPEPRAVRVGLDIAFETSKA